MSFFDNGPIKADAAKAQDAYAPIPEGDYLLNVLKSEERPTKSGDPMLSLTFQIDPATETYGGRKLFANIMLDHTKETVKAMGQRQLHALMLMAGMSEVSDPSDFLGRTIAARVKIQIRSDTGEKQNQVVFEKPKSEAHVATAFPTDPAPAAKKDAW